jgi:hypothetical protein
MVVLSRPRGLHKQQPHHAGLTGAMKQSICSTSICSNTLEARPCWLIRSVVHAGPGASVAEGRTLNRLGQALAPSPTIQGDEPTHRCSLNQSRPQLVCRLQPHAV